METIPESMAKMAWRNRIPTSWGCRSGRRPEGSAAGGRGGEAAAGEVLGEEREYMGAGVDELLGKKQSTPRPHVKALSSLTPEVPVCTAARGTRTSNKNLLTKMKSLLV